VFGEIILGHLRWLSRDFRVDERRGGSVKPGNNGADRSATAHLAKTAIFTVLDSMGNNTSGW